MDNGQWTRFTRLGTPARGKSFKLETGSPEPLALGGLDGGSKAKVFRGKGGSIGSRSPESSPPFHLKSRRAECHRSSLRHTDLTMQHFTSHTSQQSASASNTSEYNLTNSAAIHWGYPTAAVVAWRRHHDAVGLMNNN
jgi:hypothetical protein